MAYQERERKRRVALIILAIALVALLVFVFIVKPAAPPAPTPSPPPTPAPTEYKPTQNPPNAVNAVFVPDHAVCEGTTCTITKTVYGEYRDIFASSLPVTANISFGYMYVDSGLYRFWIFGLAQQDKQNYTDGAIEVRLYEDYGYVYYNLGGGKWAGLYLEYFNVNNFHVYLPGRGTGVPDRVLDIKIEVDRNNAIVYINGQPASYGLADKKPSDVKVIWTIVAYTTVPGTYKIKFA